MTTTHTAPLEKHWLLLLQFKKDGNTAFIKKKYKKALKCYEQAFLCISIHIPQIPLNFNDDPSIKAKDYLSTLPFKDSITFNSESKEDLNNKTILNINELRLEFSKIYSNRAICYLRLKLYKECIWNCMLSLEYNACNLKSIYRRAKAYELNENYIQSLQDFHLLKYLEEDSVAAIEGCKRLRNTISQKSDPELVYTNSIKVLTTVWKSMDSESVSRLNTKAMTTKIVTNVGIIMNQIFHTREYHQNVVDLRFTHLLSEFALSVDHSIDTRMDCVRALHSCLKEMTDDSKFNQNEQILVKNAFCGQQKIHGSECYVEQLLLVSEKYLQCVIQYFESLDDALSSKRDEIIHESSFISHLIGYLIEIACNQYLFEKYSERIFYHCIQYFKKLNYKYFEEKSQLMKKKICILGSHSDLETKENDEIKEEEKEEKSESKDIHMCVSDILVNILKHLSDSAMHNSTSNYRILEKIRHTFVYQFLLTDFANDYRINQNLIRFFVCTSGKKSVSDQVNDQKLSNLKSKYESQISEIIHRPLIYTLRTRKFSPSKNKRLVAALRALFIVLQSNFSLGCSIASKEDSLNCIVEVATLNQNQNDFKQVPKKKIKVEEQPNNVQQAMNAVKKLKKLKSNMNGKKDDEVEQQNIHIKKSIKLECISEDVEQQENGNANNSDSNESINELSYLACEVLALACSHGPIRKAILESNNQYLFAWILSSDDLIVRAYAASALAKFAAIDEDSRELALGGSHRCLLACCAIIHYLLKLENDDVNGSVYDFHGMHLLEDYQMQKRAQMEWSKDEEFYSFKLPLMNMCIESISYLTLHVETKMRLIEKKNQLLKLLLSLQNTRYFQMNRSLRHGLLSIILNCCLSKQDVVTYMNEKEKQLMKLKKVVARGMPNNPTKEDDIIQSRAGDARQILAVQEQLIEANCIHVIYDIVRNTTRENKRIDEYIHDKIGMSEQDLRKIKKREEERATRQWHPNKTPPTAKQITERKILSHKSTEKIRYQSMQLEETLQMKVAQVLMMMADQNKYQMDIEKDDIEEQKSNNNNRQNIAAKKKKDFQRINFSHEKIMYLRGKLIQQNAIRLLLDLYQLNTKKKISVPKSAQICQMSAVAIARLCISTNPVLFNVNHLKPMITCLLELLRESEHELYTYEALLALCNIASLPDSDIKMDIVQKDGWSTVRDSFEEMHPMINGAVLEVWCNLCTFYDAGLQKLWINRKIDIKIVTLFLRHDSVRVQRAAVNILAIASNAFGDEDIARDICKEIALNGGVILLQCVLNMRQASANERFQTEEEMKQMPIDREIISRIRMIKSQMNDYGYQMSNLSNHGMTKDIIKEFKKFMGKAQNKWKLERDSSTV